MSVAEVCPTCGFDEWATDDVGKWRCAACGRLSPRMYGADESDADQELRDEFERRFFGFYGSSDAEDTGYAVPDEFDDDEQCDFTEHDVIT